ncbi:glycerate kinase [Tamlana agarivorans]|uniref:Glycerate kinase n=1 Tax=Pseudotamlana agarivorans TaxID=481183 RepID=A0ACC5U8Y8_9FLAO|nr:glycerate kinase [Tamlana agarivorans]MBU2950719.1 glycerate kinase [Tamlana agarivorans]
MKLVLAPDKFKNSLTALQFCDAVEAGIKEIHPGADIVKLPLADGGDGTIEVLKFYLKAKFIQAEVHNPFFEKILATYLYSEVSKTAFIEMAEASGLKLLHTEQFDCKNTTTLGTGDLIVDALNRGAKSIILGLGGSATNDCGIGMASALGYRFLDERGNEVIPIGSSLSQIKTIDVSKVHPSLTGVNFQIACDVDNPLYGKNGAVYTYANQKGATAVDMVLLEQGVVDFSKVLEQIFKIDVQAIKGAGAAGGMGIASKVFLNGALLSGIQLVKDLADFDAKIIDADWIITGEGKLDFQTLSGKTIGGVLHSAKAINIKVAALCGAVDLDEIELKDFGIQYSDAVLRHAGNLNNAMKHAFEYVQLMAKNFAKNKL